MEQGYNGWANYETWQVALWLDYDRGLYEYVQELKRNTPTNLNSETPSRSYRRQQSPCDEEASLYSDMLNGALSDVNWDAIAEQLLEES